MNILGISAFCGGASAALFRDGRLVSAAREENFSSAASGFPLNAVNFCLQAGDITVNDVDIIAFHEKPYLKLYGSILAHLKSYPFSFTKFLNEMPVWLQDRLILPLYLKRELGYTGKTLFVPQHSTHAGCAFFPSGFKRAAVLVADGSGEVEGLSYGVAEGPNVVMKGFLQYPASLGRLYKAAAHYSGFKSESDMEIAATGHAFTGENEFLNLFRRYDNGSFGVNRRFVRLSADEMTIKGNLCADKTSPEIAAAKTVAAFQQILLGVVRFIKSETGEDNLCLAGTLFSNSLLADSIVRSGVFNQVSITPFAGNNGAAMGAAALVSAANGLNISLSEGRFGPEIPVKQARRILINAGFDCPAWESGQALKKAAEILSSGKKFVWFQEQGSFDRFDLSRRAVLSGSQSRPEGYYCALVQREEAENVFDTPVPARRSIVSLRGGGRSMRVFPVEKNHSPDLWTLLDECKSSGVRYLMAEPIKSPGLPESGLETAVAALKLPDAKAGYISSVFAGKD